MSAGSVVSDEWILCPFCLVEHMSDASCRCARCGCHLHPQFIECVTIGGERQAWCPACAEKEFQKP